MVVSVNEVERAIGTDSRTMSGPSIASSICAAIVMSFELKEIWWFE
ncbi:MAG: hypothetical protein F2622_02510 [Actinobacteria bacterium]|nr:hypothetical protein [Actinomycetota bacterium]